MIRFIVLWAATALPVPAEPVFEDMSAHLPPHSYVGGWEHFVGGGVAVFDCNDDGLPDIFAAGGTMPPLLLENTGEFTFRQGDLFAVTGVTGGYPLDVDNDGIMDLFVLRVGVNLMLRGTGACQFEDATALWGLPPHDAWTTAFSAWWHPDADRPTMAIGNYVDRNDSDGPFEACDGNLVLNPVADGYEAQALAPGFCPLSMLAAYDLRGKLALRISNDRHYYISGGSEQMWDIAAERFLGVDDGWPQLSLWGMGIASRDLDGDGRDEVMLTSMGDQVLQIAGPDGFYRNAPYAIGTYAQRPHVGDDGRPSTGWHAEFGDIDNDGRADLFIAKGNVDQMPGMAMEDPNNLLHQQPDGRFKETAATAGVATTARSRGAALADFDGDGRLDLLVSNRRAPLEIYRNITPGTENWLRIALFQQGPNRNAIGARISVETPAGKQTAQTYVGGGHAGGQALPLHFGLGAAARARVTVVWPDGATQTETLDAGGTHVIAKSP